MSGRSIISGGLEGKGEILGRRKGLETWNGEYIERSIFLTRKKHTLEKALEKKVGGWGKSP